MAGFRAALERIAADPAGLEPMGQAAQARVQALFTWARKAEQVLEVYDWVLGGRAARPDPVAGQAHLEHQG